MVIGGMDIYVRQFGLAHHDQFYTNQTLVDAFKNYTTQVVSRYMNCTGVLSWEIANDARLVHFFCMARRYMTPHRIGVAPHYLPLLIAPQRQSPSGMQQWLTIFVLSILIISSHQGRCQSSLFTTYSHHITGLRGLCA